VKFLEYVLDFKIGQKPSYNPKDSSIQKKIIEPNNFMSSSVKYHPIKSSINRKLSKSTNFSLANQQVSIE
jgi:hypothetical protein